MTPLDFDTAHSGAAISHSRRSIIWRFDGPLTFGHNVNADYLWVSAEETEPFVGERVQVHTRRRIANEHLRAPDATHTMVARQVVALLVGRFSERCTELFATRHDTEIVTTQARADIAQHQAAWWKDRVDLAWMLPAATFVRAPDMAQRSTPDGFASVAAYVFVDGERVGWVDSNGHVRPEREWAR